MPTALTNITESELVDALKVADGRNDLFPPRDGDKVAGRIAAGFARGLHTRLQDGSYQPDPADFVTVRKPGLLTRPAAVMTLKDRVVFEALVAKARPKIQRRLPPDTVAIWPRADGSTPSWKKLDEFVLTSPEAFVLHADVAGFYESIDHARLRRALADAGVDAMLTDTLITFLRMIMGADRGLPQGLGSSDSLATLYLAGADRELIASGVRFARHGDDYRLLAPTRDAAVKAAHFFEAALRRCALLPNGRKLWIQPRQRYEAESRDVTTASEEFKVRIREARVDELGDKSDEELAEIASEYEIDEDAQWRYFYHGSMDPEEFRDLIAPFLNPSAQEVLEELYRDAINRQGDLPAQLRHARIVYCLQRLASVKAPGPLETVLEALRDFPDETDELCSYLLSLCETHADRVAVICGEFLVGTAYMTDWQQAWVLRVLSRCVASAEPATLAAVTTYLSEPAMGWLPRLEAARVLAANGTLRAEDARALRAQAPEAYKSDIAGLVAANHDRLAWSESFLDGIREDHLADVVIKGIIDSKS